MDTAEIGAIDEALRADVEQLVASFETLGIPYQSWGPQGLQRFTERWKAGEIGYDPENPLGEYWIETIGVTVLWEINDRTFKLTEKRHVLKDGKIIPVPPKAGASMTRQIKVEETSHRAATRCLVENLGQTKNGFDDSRLFDFRSDGMTILDPISSAEFPGFSVIEHQKQFVCRITALKLHSELYELQLADKTIVFGWV